jgi:predicted ester cyclase
MGDIQGREAFKGLVAQRRSAVPDVHCEVENVVADGDLAGWVVRATGTHTGEGLGFPPTGKSFGTVSANIGRFRGELAAEHRSEQGMFPMLRQLGLMPAPPRRPDPPPQMTACSGDENVGVGAPADRPRPPPHRRPSADPTGDRRKFGGWPTESVPFGGGVVVVASLRGHRLPAESWSCSCLRD